MNAELFFDTSIIVYAFDNSEVEKHNIALDLVENAMNDLKLSLNDNRSCQL